VAYFISTFVGEWNIAQILAKMKEICFDYFLRFLMFHLGGWKKKEWI
jgi:hypothetical protein